MNDPRWAWGGLAARIILGSILIVSGASKRSTPVEEFAVVIEAYDVVPVDAAQSLAALLPWVELFVGFSLLLGFACAPASAGAGAMLTAFIFALLSTKLRGIELPNCGCFGSSFHVPPMTTALMDAVLLVGAVLSYLKGAQLFSLDNWARPGYTSRG